MLGGSEGGELLQPLKNRFPNAGILILSSIDLPSEKAHWLERGADDYLGKPFELSELVARLRKVARTQRAPATLVGGDIVVDPVTQTTMANGKRIDLTRKEFLLLSLLMRYPGQVFSKSQILDRVWQIETTVESNVVEVTVRNVRKKLAEAKAKGTIESRRHVGYWFEA